MTAAEEIYHDIIGPIEGRLIATVRRLMRDPDEAEDALQEVLATVWSKLARIHRHPNPEAYVMRICLSRCYDALRRRARRKKTEVLVDEEWRLDANVPPIPLPMPEPTTGPSLQQIHGVIASLPRKQAQAVMLRLLHEHPYDAIARVLGCSEQSARSHVSKGRARLREILG